MKKQTKKKLARYAGKAALGMLKLVTVYPAKGLWYLGKKGYQGLQQAKAHRQQQKIEQDRPNLQPIYEALTEVKPKTGNFHAFEHKLFTNKSTIGLILGARGSGKSGIGMRLLENFAAKTSKKVYALGFKPESLPPWIRVIQNIQELENDAAVLIDEGGIEFSSRKSMSDANTLLSEILLIARHKDLSVMFIAQNSANLEINAIRQADYLILKPSSLLQKDFERKKIKDIYESIEPEFEELKETSGLTYIYADIYRGFVSNTLPGFWSEKVSKGYAGR